MLVRKQDYNNFVADFSSKLYNLREEKEYSEYIFLCVGSDKITGDAFGPLVGRKLKTLFSDYYQNVSVRGTLEETICATNIEAEIEKIQKECGNPCIIAIDSAFGSKEYVGKIMVSNQKMNFGKGIRKKVVEIGEISIKGIVAVDSKLPKYNYHILQNTSLNIVVNLAEITADGIYQVMKYG